MKCSQCNDIAEMSLTWPASLGIQASNFCGSCASMACSKFSHTEAFQCATFGEPKSRREIEELTAEV